MFELLKPAMIRLIALKSSFKVYISVVGFLYVLKVLTLLMVMAKEKCD